MKLITTVCVNPLGVNEAHFEVVQHCWLVEVDERCEILLPYQEVGVS